MAAAYCLCDHARFVAYVAVSVGLLIGIFVWRRKECVVCIGIALV